MKRNRTEYNRRFRHKNRDRINANSRARYAPTAHPKKILTAEERKERRKITLRRYHFRNREKHNAYQLSKYHSVKGAESFKSARRERMREYVKRRSETDLNYRILRRVRSRMAQAIRLCGGKKAKDTAALTGCSIDLLRAWLQTKFKAGMTWENYGEWHIDHVIPCAEFDLRRVSQQRICFHYSNLQPLWGVENLVKGKKTQ